MIFRVAMALLEDHQDQLLMCDSFEEIMEYLKVNHSHLHKHANFAFVEAFDIKKKNYMRFADTSASC